MADQHTCAVCGYRPHIRNRGAFAALIALILFALWPWLPEDVTIIRDYSVEVVGIAQGHDTEGSGTVIAHAYTRDGHATIIRSIVLTNAHVVADMDPAKITIVWRSEEIEARIVSGSVDPERDLALLAVDEILPVAPLARDGMRDDEFIVSAGNQLGNGLILSEGRAGPSVRLANGSDAIEVRMVVNRGSSGSGAFVSRYGRFRCAGVVRGIPVIPASESSTPVYVADPTRGFVIPMSVVNAYLAEHPL